jgi:hypothetical protein
MISIADLLDVYVSCVQQPRSKVVRVHERQAQQGKFGRPLICSPLQEFVELACHIIDIAFSRFKKWPRLVHEIKDPCLTFLSIFDTCPGEFIHQHLLKQ